MLSKNLYIARYTKLQDNHILTTHTNKTCKTAQPPYLIHIHESQPHPK